MKFGTLQVALLTGETRSYPLDLPSALVGRGEGSNIHLDDFSISRRHARLTVDSGRLMVEDLASAAGTFINGERLTPNVRYLLDDSDQLRFGDLEVSYFPPPPADAVTAVADDDTVFSPTGLHVALVSPAAAIDPGRQATATLTVTNRGRVVDTVSIEITDLPADWYTIETPQSSLVPGAHLEVRLTLHPPRRHDSLAGHYDFTVKVTSREHQREAIAIGSFEVLPFESFSLSFEVVRSSRNFRLVAENRGNQPARYRLAGQDDEQVFRYEFDAPVVQLPPGGKQVVGLKVRRPRQLFGPKVVLPFEVAGSAESGSEVRARGQLAVDPPLQKFRMPAMFALAALVLGVTALAILILTDGETVQTAGAEDEYAGVHLCDEEGAAEEQQDKNEQAAQAQPNTEATVAGTFDGGRPIFGQVDANGAPFFAQNDARWANAEYARSTELPAGKDWCGTTISQCGCAMTSVAVMLALYNVLTLPDGQPLTPESLNAWFNGDARRTDRGWVSRGYIYGDVIWTAANELSGEIAKAKPGTPTVRFVRTGSGSEDQIRAALPAGRPIILEGPGHWIAAVGLDGDTILINDPFYRDRTTLDAYKGKVRSSVIYEPSSDLSAVVFTAPSDVAFRVVDKQGRVVGTGDTTAGATDEPIIQIPGASVSTRRAWRDPTCIEKAPPAGAGTHQIVLPGSRDDYRIEILGTGDQGGSVAIHTYGRDGTASIATIEGQEGTTAELDYDPNAPAPVVRTPGAGESTPAPASDGGGEGGGPGDETPTPGATPTPSPSPAPTGTPFVEATANITLGAEPGQLRVEISGTSGFELGDPIRFAPGLPNEEDNVIVGFGSFLLATPLKFAHGPGETIRRLPRPPGQGPGLPPGITPPAETGPLLPPDTVGVACSTIYQPSPRQATFICDLQVTGTYTTTRWTLNGQVVPDFTGSSSFLMAFNDDTPATVSATVCNVTICRSVTRPERIVFPANLGGTTFTGTGGAGTGATPVATPPAGGAVAVVCATEFPITPDGQIARFSCEANFSGDFTSVSWSAPGGTPANQSGKGKTFTTTVRNEPGAPVSLRVTATVCNFGTCRTSEPTTVGIGRTITAIDTDPKPAVHQRHSVTLFAVVKGTGTIVPQGGTVQFYADDLPIGPAATLFTVGGTSVAQIAVQTGGSAGLATVGQHTLQAAYSGGINAFGSTSPLGGLEVLPPIPDDCDSVDEDPPANGVGVTDDTCDFSTPKGLGGGTVLNSVTLSAGTQDGAPNAIIISPGQQFSVSGDAGRTEYCPGCIRQVYIGIGANATATTSAIGPTCVYSGGLPASNPGQAWGPLSSADLNHPLRAPTVPGVYYLRATTSLEYSCLAPAVGSPDRSVGRIVVRQQVVAQIDVFTPTDGDTNPWNDDLSGPTVNEVAAESRMLVRVRVPAGALGRVDLTLVDSSGAPAPALVAAICPPSGQVSLGPSQFHACTPGEGRVLSPVLDISLAQLTISGRYQNPSPTRLIDPSTGGDKAYPFYQAPAQGAASNSVELTVLRPSQTTLTASRTGDVAICRSWDECVSYDNNNIQTHDGLVLTANVGARPPLSGPPATGGEVTFQRRPASSNSDDDWVAQVCLESGSAVKTLDAEGEATCQVLPGLDGASPDLGSYEFRARFDRGTAPGRPALQPSASVPEGPVDFVKAPSSVTVGVEPAEAPIGGTITVTATVTGTHGFAPDTLGTVQFRANGSNIGAAQSLSCSTTCTATLLNYATGSAPMDEAGDYGITAAYSGDAWLAESAPSAPETVTLTRLKPSVTINDPENLEDPDSASVPIDGRVKLEAELSNLTCPGGSNCAAGGVFKFYLGDPGPDGTGGQLIATTAALAGAEVSKSVDVTIATSPLGSVAIHNGIRARYEPADNNKKLNAANSANDKSLTVTKGTPTISLGAPSRTTDAAPDGIHSLGDVYSITVEVNAGQAEVLAATGGTVTLKANGTTVAWHTFVDGDVGSHTFESLSTTTGVLATPDLKLTFTAEYAGNTNLNSGTSPASPERSLTLSNATPTVTLSVPSPVTLGDAVTLTVTVEGPPNLSVACNGCLRFESVSGPGHPWTSPAVSVLETVGDPSIGTAELTFQPGDAPFTMAGTWQLRAVYAGNAAYSPGSSLSITLALRKATPTVTISSTNSPVTAGSPLTVTVAVSGSDMSVTSPAGGTVTLLLGTTELGTVIVATDGTAWFTNANAIQTGTSTSLPPSGAAYSVTARFNGNALNGNVEQAVSPAVDVTVNAIATTLVATASQPGGDGSATTLSATVTPASGVWADVDVGSVQFKIDGADQGSPVNVTDGVAALSVTLSPGTYQVTATYTGSGNYASSADTTNFQIVVT